MTARSAVEGTEETVGLCVVDKPTGWTSHDVVARSRRLFGTRKVGHSGTLDPMATGVLVLGIGRATRLLTFLSGLPKSYAALIRFGVETDTLDADGEVTVTHHEAPPTLAQVRSAAMSMVGDSLQVPPMVSAKKVDGRRLHELARRGEVVERAPVPIAVERFEIRDTDDPTVFHASIDCSAGTYVRVLAADLGHSLGTGAHLVGLRRASVGPFHLDDAVTLEELDLAAAAGDVGRHVIPPTGICRVLDSIEVVPSVAAEVAHGKVLDRARLGVDDGPGPWAVIDETGGGLLAVYAAHRGDTVKPSVVLA